MTKIDRIDRLVFWLLYLITLVITVNYALGMTIQSDILTEYGIYLETIKDGYLHLEISFVSTTLLTTFVPAWIQRLTGLEPELLFKTFPMFLYSFMPAFIYLISRKYLDRTRALMSAILPLVSFFFLYCPALGRVGVSIAMASGLLWAVLNNKRAWCVSFAILTVLSHYGTTMIMALSFGSAVIVILFLRRFDRLGVTTIIATGVLLISMIAWQFSIGASSTGYVIKGVIDASVTQLIEPETYTSLVDEVTYGVDVNIPKSIDTTTTPEATPEHTPEPIPKKVKLVDKYERHQVVKQAFGTELPTMSTPRKIEWVFSWFIVLSLSFGLAYVLWKRLLLLPHAVIAVVMYGCIASNVLIPYLSYVYGVVRTYHNGLVALATVFPMIFLVFKGRLKPLSIILPAFILVIYGLCVSGKIHLLWGIVK